MSTAWSYSSIKTFEQCPKKYYHLKVLKDIKDSGSQATIYGQEVHQAAEDYVKDGTPIPEKFAYIRKVVERIAKQKGDKYTEHKMGLKKTEDGNTAYSIDYKTSKNARYADTKQLDLVAGGLFVEFPEVDTIKSALLFVVSGDLIRKNHYREHMSKYINTFEPTLDRLDTAEQTAVWNAVSGPLCRFCPVVSCEHNTR